MKKEDGKEYVGFLRKMYNQDYKATITDARNKAIESLLLNEGTDLNIDGPSIEQFARTKQAQLRRRVVSANSMTEDNYTRRVRNPDEPTLEEILAHPNFKENTAKRTVQVHFQESFDET